MKNRKGLFRSRSSTLYGLNFKEARVTSDGGLLHMRELDNRLGSGELIDPKLGWLFAFANTGCQCEVDSE
jgi:hypothetical protein